MLLPRGCVRLMISKEELLDRQRRLIAYRKKQEAMHRERCIYCGRFVSMNDDQVDGSFEVVQNPGSCDPDPVEEILHWHNSCKKADDDDKTHALLYTAMAIPTEVHVK